MLPPSSMRWRWMMRTHARSADTKGGSELGFVVSIMALIVFALLI
jgi:hypothetical protein